LSSAAFPPASASRRSARNAYERNYKLLFVEDAIAAKHSEEHDRAIKSAFPRMGIVRSTADVLTAVAVGGFRQITAPTDLSI
jgi:isochorismate hydrolase